MKQILITIAAVLLVGCGESQQTTPASEAKPAGPVSEAAQPEPIIAKLSDIDIHEASINGNIEIVKKHLAAGVNVNEKDETSWTPLHFAKTKEVAELLISNGGDVNAKNNIGDTPLHQAVFDGHRDIVELLIANGADVNAKDDHGQTPLDTAIQYKKPETADLLRKHGGKTGEELKAEGK